VKIAYWDTEGNGNRRRPPLLGDIQGTPTIRLYVPKKKQSTKKIVLDYQYERKAVDMKRWVEENMPSFVERISGVAGLEKFRNKAIQHGLPQVLLFTSKAKTLALTKYLSTEFRRRLLLGEVHPTKPNKEVMEKYGIVDLPAVVVIPPEQDAEIIRYEGNGFTRNKLQSFLSKHALKEKVRQKKKDEKKQENVKVGADGEL
jgi:hypothetical protein